MRKNKDKALWLSDNFGQVTIEPLPRGLVEATLPNIYTFQDARSGLFGAFARAMSRRSLVTISQPLGRGMDEGQAMASLYDRLQAKGAENLYAYHWKPEAQSEPILRRQAYEVVLKSTHPKHDHKDPLLHDFGCHEQNETRFVEVAFDRRHLHLRAV